MVIVHSSHYLLKVYAERILILTSVPLTLLGLLEREPSDGYDLKRDYDTYFGCGKPLPYGQVYATPTRLARDGKAVAGEAQAGRPADGHAARRLRPVSSGSRRLHWIDTTTARLGELTALLTRGATPGPPERVRIR